MLSFYIVIVFTTSVKKILYIDSQMGDMWISSFTQQSLNANAAN